MATKQEEIEKLIRNFAEFLPSIQSESSEYFDELFHKRLKEIDALSLEIPLDRPILMKYLFTLCAEEFDKSEIQKQCRNKPQGYPGDYLLIDWIYTQKNNSEGTGKLWDDFFQRQKGSQAVRNRKEYFCSKFFDLCQESATQMSVLNLASGPCRDVLEAVARVDAEKQDIYFHNVDMDINAIEYGMDLVKDCKFAKFNWEEGNILKIRPQRPYDFVWSAGLFDYLNDGLFVKMLKKMWHWVKDGGKIIVGNFHPRNPSRLGMEWGSDWFLFHRTEEQLRALCHKAGFSSESIKIGQEPLGINLFLEISK